MFKSSPKKYAWSCLSPPSCIDNDKRIGFYWFNANQVILLHHIYINMLNLRFFEWPGFTQTYISAFVNHRELRAENFSHIFDYITLNVMLHFNWLFHCYFPKSIYSHFPFKYTAIYIHIVQTQPNPLVYLYKKLKFIILFESHAVFT